MQATMGVSEDVLFSLKMETKSSDMFPTTDKAIETSRPEDIKYSLVLVTEQPPDRRHKQRGSIEQKTQIIVDQEKQSGNVQKIIGFTRIFLIFLKCYLLPHVLVAFITILVIIIQNALNKGCFLPPNCLCNNDIGLKVRDMLRDYFSFYVFLFLICTIHSLIDTKLAKSFVFISMFLFMLGYYIMMDEKLIIDIYIYLFLMLVKTSTEYYCLRKDKNNKGIGIQILKLNLVYIILYINYIFYTFLLMNMKQYIIANIQWDGGKNLVQFIISVYTIALTFLLDKIHFGSALFLISKSPENHKAIILSSSIMLCYLIGIPASNLLHLEIGSLASYFWLFSYSNVLTTCFLNINGMKFIYLKVKQLLTVKKEAGNNTDLSKNTENKFIFNMVSKTALDMMFITSIRPIILFYTKRWMGKYGNSKLFKNCQYEYDENYFQIEMFGLFSMIFLNFFIVSSICVYSAVTKKKVLHYRDNLKLFNIYILFLLHCFYEATLTVFY